MECICSKNFEGGIFLSQKIKQVKDLPIGSNLQHLRNKAGLSQDAVAAKLQLMGLSISREVVSQMELGKCNIRVSVLQALKDIYEIDSYDEFFRDL